MPFYCESPSPCPNIPHPSTNQSQQPHDYNSLISRTDTRIKLPQQMRLTEKLHRTERLFFKVQLFNANSLNSNILVIKVEIGPNVNILTSW